MRFSDMDKIKIWFSQHEVEVSDRIEKKVTADGRKLDIYIDNEGRVQMIRIFSR